MMTDEPVQTFENVWDAVEDTPDQAENMTLRSDVMIAITAAVESWQLTQGQTAA